MAGRASPPPPVRCLPGARIVNSLVSAGCVIEGTVENSVLSPGVRVGPRAVVRGSVLWDDVVVEADAQVSAAIADKRVVFAHGCQVGVGESVPSEEKPASLSGGATVLAMNVRVPAGARVGKNCLVHFEATERRHRDAGALGQERVARGRRQAGAAVKVTFLAREFPPHVYGGAGVHLKNLARELARSVDVEVRCIGDQDVTEGRLRVRGYQAWPRMWEGEDKLFNSTLGTLLGQPVAGPRSHRCRRGPLAHLVWRLFRLHGQGALPPPLCGDRAQPGAVAALEGGTTRPLVSPDLVGREGGAGERGSGRGGLDRRAAGDPGTVQREPADGWW